MDGITNSLTTFRTFGEFCASETTGYVETALEILSTSCMSIKESAANYYSSIPRIAHEGVGLTTSFAFALGGEWGGAFDFTIEAIPRQNLVEGFGFSTVAVAGARSACFTLLLTAVNALIRPLFVEYFPKDWGCTQLFLEIAITIALVSIPMYFALPLLSITSCQLGQMIIISIPGRLYWGYQYDSEAGKHVFESKLNRYEVEATPWCTFYSNLPSFV